MRMRQLLENAVALGAANMGTKHQIQPHRYRIMRQCVHHRVVASYACPGICQPLYNCGDSSNHLVLPCTISANAHRNRNESLG